MKGSELDSGMRQRHPVPLRRPGSEGELLYGAPDKQGTFHAHGIPLGVDEVRRTKQNLGWPLEPPFYVPDEALAQFRGALERGREIEQAWRGKLDDYAASPLGWERWTGSRGAIIGVNRFGASVLKQDGFTVDHVVAQALALVGAKPGTGGHGGPGITS